jgi:hypothetical protein
LSSSGGKSSPRESEPWSMPQSWPVVGCQAKPMVLRRPRAKTEYEPVAGSMRSRVACSGLDSVQALQVLPTERESAPSGPKARVRLPCWPPSGRCPRNSRGVPSEPSERRLAT